MSNSDKNKIISILLVVLGIFIAGVPFLHILESAWKAGFGFNRTTLVSALFVVALIGVFVLWLKGGSAATPSELTSAPTRADQRHFWRRVKGQGKQDFLFKLLGLLAVIVAVLLVIGYVAYIEPTLK